MYQALNSAMFPFVFQGIFTPELFGLFWMDQFVSLDRSGWTNVEQQLIQVKNRKLAEVERLENGVMRRHIIGVCVEQVK